MMTPNKTRFLVTTALAASALLGLALGLSACGKMSPLETAPPMWGDKAKADWSASHEGKSSSASSSDGIKRETERALPDPNGPNNSPDPYKGNKPISEAPLEGVGNDEGH